MTVTGKETTPLLRTPIPGPRTKDLVKRDGQALVTTTKTAPISAVQGRSVVVEDADGNRLLDFTAGIGVLNTGHCHPKITVAIAQQAGKLMHFAGTDFYYEQQVALAERLNRLAPVGGRAKTFYVQSGTEANEAAIKVAKRRGRSQFLAFLGGFHGRTMGSLALTSSKIRQREGFFPAMPGVVHTPFPNPYRNLWRIDGYDEPDELSNRAIEAIETLFHSILPPQETAAVFWEPVQGEGGYVVPPKPFPRMLRKLCDEHGILLVADEVQTGFGRTGKWFATEHFGIKVDVATMAKALGSGYPIGACVVRAGLDFDAKGRHSNTFGGNVLGCAAATATLDIIKDEDLVGNSARMGAVLGKRLEGMKRDHARIGDHRGLGLMRALEFVKADGAPNGRLRDAVAEAAWKRGLILLGCGKSSLRVIPALTVNEEQVHGAMDILEAALKAEKA
jgi:4-aminobutyrate aminotransferase